MEVISFQFKLQFKNANGHLLLENGSAAKKRSHRRMLKVKLAISKQSMARREHRNLMK